MLINKNERFRQSNPHDSEASLTAATGGDLSYSVTGGGSERDLLLSSSSTRPVWWVSHSQTIPHEDEACCGCGRTRLERSTKLVFLTLLLLLSLSCMGLWFNFHNDTFPMTQSENLLHHHEETTLEDLQWWEEPTNITTTLILLDSIFGDKYKHDFLDNKDNSHINLRWGILGAGRIARDFTMALRMAGSHVQAVAAGSLPHALQRAQAFADTYEIPHAYGTYQELAVDPSVDLVYVATTNHLHAENVIQMLQAGKNVLVEKPMAVTYREAQEMVAAAKQQKRLLLVNFWTRFFPIYDNYALPLLHNKSLTESTDLAMRGDFGFPAPPHDTLSQRLFNKTLGGGATLDLGCYLVDIAVRVAAQFAKYHTTFITKPVDIQATGTDLYQGESFGVDTETSFSLQWKGGRSDKQSSFIVSGQVSFRRPSSFDVEIMGDKGRLVVHRPANAPHAATVYQHEQIYGPVTAIEYAESLRVPFNDSFGPEQYPGSTGFVYVIRDIERCMATKGIPGRKSVVNGCLELEKLPIAHQLMTAEITQEIMDKIGYWG